MIKNKSLLTGLLIGVVAAFVVTSLAYEQGGKLFSGRISYNTSSADRGGLGIVNTPPVLDPSLDAVLAALHQYCFPQPEYDGHWPLPQYDTLEEYESYKELCDKLGDLIGYGH